ncbi:MAG: hypothetical protein OHK0012_09020 [Synechococcales cyanobacterium]
MLTILETLQALDHHVQPSSPRYGRLLAWQRPLDPVWHYGIGLSDTHVFDTGLLWCPVERQQAQIVQEGVIFPPRQVISRLRHALMVFRDWDYHLLSWNCEHLARLIVSDQPRCHQSQPLWWLCDLTPEGDHKTAQQALTRYIEFVQGERHRV